MSETSNKPTEQPEAAQPVQAPEAAAQTAAEGRGVLGSGGETGAVDAVGTASARAEGAEILRFAQDDNGGQDDNRAAQGDNSAPSEAVEAEAPKQAITRRRMPKPRPSTVIAVVILAAGVGLLAYPTFSDWWNSYHQSRAIASFVQAVQETDPAVLERMMNDARAYNERLLADNDRWHMTEAELEEYNSLLDLTGNGVMGYVQISSINVDYPIYHGMDEAVLQIAIGHLEGTSLPVGGANTHTALSGHRGLPSARLFTDLDKLREGDTFTITILNETFTYEIDQIRIVLPEDLSNLNIEAGQDYATLITCTPYGINTHRMLVRGHRIENIEDADAITADALQIPRYIAIPAVAVPLLFLFLVGLLVYYRIRRPEIDQELVVEAIKERIHANDELKQDK